MPRSASQKEIKKAYYEVCRGWRWYVSHACCGGGMEGGGREGGGEGGPAINTVYSAIPLNQKWKVSS